ncbi:MAG: MFS transporter [Thermoplasmata archaeon]
MQNVNSKINAIFSGFPKMFWVANTLELVERGAYYGMMAVFSYHLVYNLNVPSTVVGILMAILMPFLYFVPIIAATLAEKYGYKSAIIVAFALLLSSYLLMANIKPLDKSIASSSITAIIPAIAPILLAIVSLGFGAGTYKPVISATIAHVTTEEKRNFGYSIYYWMINLGACIVPLLIGITIPKAAYNLAFYVSAAMICANIMIAIIFYKSPRERVKDKSVTQALSGMFVVLKDKNFTLLLLIYSGFWFMYSMNHSFLPIYMKDFKVMPDWFEVPILAAVNPGTIIALGPFLGKLSEGKHSLNVMLTGISIYVLGFSIIGLFINPMLFMLGIIIYSIGEFVAHPNYISYVSKLAPKDKVGIYMGYSFLPIGLGQIFGSLAGGFLYSGFAENMQMPKLFWAVIISIGLLTLSGLLLYRNYLGVKPGAAASGGTAKGAKAILTKGAKIKEANWSKTREAKGANAKEAGGSILLFVHIASQKISKLSFIVPIVVMIVILSVSAGAGTDKYYRGADGQKVTDWSGYQKQQKSMDKISEYLNENSDVTKTVKIGDTNIITVTFTLRWTDESAGTFMQNEPDQFALNVELPNKTSYSAGPQKNSIGGEGKIAIAVSYSPQKDPSTEGSGEYKITIKAGDCGDVYYKGTKIKASDDKGNDWTLDVGYEYYTK